ncbi:MAG: exosortase C-terminal domain/associated protein EpsI [Terracidiphilus sp.]
MRNFRFWTVFLLLAGTALLLESRGDSERRPPRETLSQFPDVIAGWTGIDQPIDSETLQVLGAGDYLERVYNKGLQTPPIELFIAYVPSQRTGASIHSPKHCLPGAGWAFESSKYVDLKDANGKPHRVGEYVISEGDNRDFVIYWYQAHGRSVVSEYIATMYLVTDAIRMNRTDGGLVRVITPIEPGSGRGVPAARTRAESFVTQLWPTLPHFIPN